VRIFSWLRGIAKRAITSLPWIQGGSSPTAVSADRALSLIPLFASVRILADTIASLPIQTFLKLGLRREPQSFVPDLLFKPSARDNLFEWLHKLVVSLALRGNAYGLIVTRDGFGYPTTIEWFNPDDVHVDDQVPAAPKYYWRGRQVPNEDMVHIPWFVLPGHVKGLSPMAAFASTIGVGLAATEYGKRWFDGGGVPPSTMKNTMATLDTEKAAEIRDRTAAAISSGKPLVFGKDWDFNAISINPSEAQFIETIQMNATQIAAIFGVPPEMVGGKSGGSLTYNSPEQNTIYLATVTLRPWLVRIEDRLTALLPPGNLFAKFNVDAMIRTDLKTRYEAHAIALDPVTGWMTQDEVRALEERAPLTGNANRASARDLAEVAQTLSGAVGKVLEPDEARNILNAIGASLPPASPALTALAAQSSNQPAAPAARNGHLNGHTKEIQNV
jgi:HK97 family phage portal protein